jgi:hypothetical protein
MLLAVGPSPCPVPALLLFDEFVGRYGHDDLARLEFNEIRERKHREKGHPAD